MSPVVWVAALFLVGIGVIVLGIVGLKFAS